MIVCYLLLTIANKIAKGGIGGGDIKLLTATGFMVGIYVVFEVLIYALVSCILYTIFKIIIKKYNAKEHFPFGPFIYMGFVIMCLINIG